jgi:hypothetical protein
LLKKFKAPEIRELTLAEQQQLRDLGKAMAEQALRILSRGRSLGCANLRKYLTEFGVLGTMEPKTALRRSVF